MARYWRRVKRKGRGKGRTAPPPPPPVAKRGKRRKKRPRRNKLLRLSGPAAPLWEAVICVTALLLFSFMAWAVYEAAGQRLRVNINDVSEMKASYGSVEALHTLSGRFGIPFGELLTVYMANNRFFPSRGLAQSENALERQYIISYTDYKERYGVKLKPYQELIEAVLTEMTCFPIQWDSPETLLCTADSAGVYPSPGEAYGYMYGDGFALKSAESKHTGIDIYDRDNVPGRLTVVSVCGGVVESTGQNGANGIYAVIRADSGNRYFYFHLEALEQGIEQGARVAAGQPLGRMGNTGSACKAGALYTRLHFGLRAQTEQWGEIWLNPYLFLRLTEKQKQTDVLSVNVN